MYNEIAAISYPLNKALFPVHNYQIINAEYTSGIFSIYMVGVPGFEPGTPTTPR